MYIQCVDCTHGRAHTTQYTHRERNRQILGCFARAKEQKTSRRRFELQIETCDREIDRERKMKQAKNDRERESERELIPACMCVLCSHNGFASREIVFASTML